MNSSVPLVSIVTPCYNSVEFIERCIQSVLSQDYPNIEHIIQDGCSTDGTLDILKKYDGTVDWISEPDKGQSDGLNRALQRCKGDIICVLNADDELLSHAASWAVENFRKYPDFAVIYGDQYDVNPEGKIVNKTIGPDYDFKKIFCVESVIPAQAAFIRRECLEKVGLYADVTRKTCPDFEMFVRIGLTFSMLHVPGFVCKYRWHPGSEGYQAPVIPAMINSKLEVISRVVCDPDTPESIRSLSRHARSGALWWGGKVMLFNKQKYRAFTLFINSFLLDPNRKKFIELFNTPLFNTPMSILTIVVLSPFVCLSMWLQRKYFGFSSVVLTHMAVLMLSVAYLYYKGMGFIYHRKWVVYRGLRDFSIITVLASIIGWQLWSREKTIGPATTAYLYLIVLVASVTFVVYKMVMFVKRKKVHWQENVTKP